MTVEAAVKEYCPFGQSKALIRMAQDNLMPGEEALYAHGAMCIKDRGDGRDEALLVVTQKRVLCASRRIIARELSSIPLRDIHGMQIVRGETLVRRELHIEGFTETIILVDTLHMLNVVQKCIQCAIDNYDEFNAPGAFDVPDETGSETEAKEEIEEETEEEPTVTAQFTVGLSAAQELREWKALLDEGAITEEEYNAKKQQLLGL